MMLSPLTTTLLWIASFTLIAAVIIAFVQEINVSLRTEWWVKVATLGVLGLLVGVKVLEYVGGG